MGTEKTLSSSRKLQEKCRPFLEALSSLSEELKTLNAQIHFTGQYQANKRTFAAFVLSKNKKLFRKKHAAELSAYEESRDWLKNFYPDGKMRSLNSLKEKKANLQIQLDDAKKQLQYMSEYYRDLETADTNVDAILDSEGLSKKRSDLAL